MNQSNHPRGRRSWIAGISALTLTLCLAPAHAADFPTKPISLIVHTGAGSSTDIFARELARAAEPLFGQPVVVVNRPGGSGATQMAALKSAAPDGYTLGVNTTSHLTAMRTNLKGVFKWEDFSWLTLNQLDPYVVVVGHDSPHDTLESLVQSAQNGGPGIKVGGFGTVGSAHNIAFNLLADDTKLPFSWVGYTGGPQAMTALLGKHIDAVNTNPGPVLQFAEAGRVKILGVLNEERMDAFPDVPTFAEAGVNADPSWKQVRGVFGPPDMPAERQAQIAAVFLEAMQNPGFQQYMTNTAQIYGDLGPAEYTAFIEQQDKIAADWLVKLGVTK